MCNQNIRAFKVIIFAIGIYFHSVNNSYAQDAWNLQLEPMYMGVAGADTHQSNITTTTTTYSSVTSPYLYVGGSTSTNSSNTTSQNFNMDGNVTFRGQLEYMPEDWGIGISGWWFNTSSSLNQNLNSPPQPSYSYYSPVTTYSTVNYNSNNFSVFAPYSNSGSVLSTSANNSLGVWNIDVYGIKTLGEFENGRINITFGAKFGSIDNKISETFNRSPETNNSYGYFYSNSESGSAINSANANFLIGPSIGIQGLGKYGKHRLEGFVSQSVLIGNIDYKTITSRQYLSSYSYPSYYAPYNYSYSYSYNDNMTLSGSETVAIPVTEMKIKYLYDVTENLSLGVGFFGSAWINTPMTPAAQFNDRQYKTLFFYGGLASINLRF
jgi:hypothetical protein